MSAVELANAIKSRKQIPHAYTYFNSKQPIGLYAVECLGRYYVPKRGLRSLEEAKVLADQLRLQSLETEIYKLTDGELLWVSELAVTKSVSKFSSTLDLVPGRRVTAREIEAARSSLEYPLNETFCEVTVEITEGNRYATWDDDRHDVYYSPKIFPRPALPHGVPDLDACGHPIIENIQSNDQWRLLESMLETTQPGEEDKAIYDAIEPYLPSLLDRGFELGSYAHLVVRHRDPQSVVELAKKYPSQKSLRYALLWERTELVEAEFMATGSFADIVVLSARTRPGFLKLPGYPQNYLQKLSGVFERDERLTADFITAIREADSDEFSEFLSDPFRDYPEAVLDAVYSRVLESGSERSLVTYATSALRSHTHHPEICRQMVRELRPYVGLAIDHLYATSPLRSHNHHPEIRH